MVRIYCDPDALIATFRLLLKMFIMIIDSLRKAEKESVIILNIKNMSFMIKKQLLVGVRFISEIHLKQLGFTYSARGPFTEYKEIIQTFKEAGDSRNIYQNKLEKACFQCHMTYNAYKDLAGRTASSTILPDKTFKTVNNSQYDGYQR